MTSKKLRRVFRYDFDTGVSTVTQQLDPIDLSGALSLVFDLKLTKADTDAGDILDVTFQETTDRVTWNNRLRFPNFLGDLSPSAGAPETYKMTLSCTRPLTVGEEAYEPTGSASATALAVDEVIHGPLLSPFRDSAGKQTAHRVVFTVTDAGAANADFEGNLTIWAEFYC